MTEKFLLVPLLLPLLGAMTVFLLRRNRKISQGLFLLSVFINMFLPFLLIGRELFLWVDWTGVGMDFSLKVTSMGIFFLLLTGFVTFLLSIFIIPFLYRNQSLDRYYIIILVSLSLLNGAFLADNLLFLLLMLSGGFFLRLLAMFLEENRQSAMKSLVMTGTGDVCMLTASAIMGYSGGTLSLSEMTLQRNHWTASAFILVMIGAMSRMGIVPFHSWLSGSYKNSSPVFNLFIAGFMEKIAGIYLLFKITAHIYPLKTSSPESLILLIMGGITLLLGGMMSLNRRDFREVLSYTGISQMGLILMGVGSCTWAGIRGSLLHTLIYAISFIGITMVFSTVEYLMGTGDLEDKKLRGLMKALPLTFLCFIMSAISLTGVLLTGGFFSLQGIYRGTWEEGGIFCFLALLGSLINTASLARLMQTTFIEKTAPETSGLDPMTGMVKESPGIMLLPMFILSLGGILAGIYNSSLMKALSHIWGLDTSGYSINMVLVGISIFIFIGVYEIHNYGLKESSGDGVSMLDYICDSFPLEGFYLLGDKGVFEPYKILTGTLELGAKIMVNVGHRIMNLVPLLRNPEAGIKDELKEKIGVCIQSSCHSQLVSASDTKSQSKV